MREDNDRMLRLLCIHEGVPGHYLQLAWSNRSPSLIRTIFGDGMFAEGWACYVEQVLMDVGYGADDPALLLTHWKFELRAITNTILDVETHTRGMTEEAAIDLMVRQAFQEEDEARAKWLRARLTSTQLSTYYVGNTEMLDLEIAGAHPCGGRRWWLGRGCAATARARRHRRYARLRLPDPPRVGHHAWHAAHPLDRAHPRRRGCGRLIPDRAPATRSARNMNLRHIHAFMLLVIVLVSRSRHPRPS